MTVSVIVAPVVFVVPTGVAVFASWRFVDVSITVQPSVLSDEWACKTLVPNSARGFSTTVTKRDFG